MIDLQKSKGKDTLTKERIKFPNIYGNNNETYVILEKLFEKNTIA